MELIFLFINKRRITSKIIRNKLNLSRHIDGLLGFIFQVWKLA